MNRAARLLWLSPVAAAALFLGTTGRARAEPPPAATTPNTATATATAATTTTATATAGQVQPAAKVQLFPEGALEPSGASHGRDSAAGERDHRLNSAVAEAAASTSGTFAPGWHDAERRIASHFLPPVRTVEGAPRVVAAAQQIANAQPVAVVTPPAVTRTLDEEMTEQILATQESMDAPTRYFEADVEVTVDAAGQIQGARVIQSSGRLELDDLALESVRVAFAVTPVIDPRGRAVARYRIGAARVVRVPRVSPIYSPTSRRVVGLTPQLPIRFDETTGKSKVLTPLTQEVRTRIKLLSVSSTN